MSCTCTTIFKIWCVIGVCYVLSRISVRASWEVVGYQITHTNHSNDFSLTNSPTLKHKEEEKETFIH